MDTIPSRFIRQATALGAKPLFVVKREGAYRPITWRQAAADVSALSAFLLTQQLNPRDRVLIVSENRPEWCVADLAVQAVGAWPVPIYPSLTAQDIGAIARDAQPALCIASSPEQVDKCLAVCNQQSSLRAIIAMDGAPSQDPRVISWTRALADGQGQVDRSAETLTTRREAIRPDDTATLIYTSGTTGEPKGVMLSHHNFLSNVEASLQAIPITGADLHLSFLPLSHVFERMAGWYLMLTVGATVAFAESLETVPQNMLEVRPTIMLGVPRFFEKLYARVQDGLRQVPHPKRRLVDWAVRAGSAHAACLTAGRTAPFGLRLQRQIADRLVFHKLRDKLGGRLRFFVSGSAPLSRDIGEFFFSVGVTILEGYGLTETSPVIAVNRLPVPQFGSVGPLLPGVEVRIADDGEILTRGPHVMQGYYRKPEETSQVIVDGWFHTGDIGHLDANGILLITDRKKDLIKTAGGKFVAPQRLENLCATDPYISQAFVCGDRKPYCVALIVPNAAALRRYAQEHQISGESLHDLVRDPRVQAFYWTRIEEKQQTLARFEQVKKIALLDQEFSQTAGELTPTMKAKRNVIAQRYQSLIESLYQTPA